MGASDSQVPRQVPNMPRTGMEAGGMYQEQVSKKLVIWGWGGVSPGQSKTKQKGSIQHASLPTDGSLDSHVATREMTEHLNPKTAETEVHRGPE